MRMLILSTWAQGFCLLYWRFCRPLLSTMSGNPQWLRAAYVICQADRIAASGVWSGPFPFWYIQHHSDPMYYTYNDHTMYDLELSVCVSLHKREQWNAIWNESNIAQCNAFCQSPGCSDDFTWYSRPMVFDVDARDVAAKELCVCNCHFGIPCNGWRCWRNGYEWDHQSQHFADSCAGIQIGWLSRYLSIMAILKK